MTMTNTADTNRNVAIRVDGVNKTFGTDENRSQVLYNIDLHIAPGEITLLVGPSGCGKTTLISIIAGILTPDNGEIELFGQRIDQMKTAQKATFRQQALGFIFQQFNLVNTLTLTENVMVPLLIRKEPEKQARQKAEAMLASVDLTQKRDTYPSDLSGGQQQRVAIARALVNDPKIVICDEPTSALDGPTGQRVMELMQDIALKTDRCVVIVTHDNRIYKYADRIIEMEDGRVVASKPGQKQTSLNLATKEPVRP